MQALEVSHTPPVDLGLTGIAVMLPCVASAGCSVDADYSIPTILSDLAKLLCLY